MINNNQAKKYCREDISLIKNYKQAITDSTQTWDCHHINELTFTAKELIKQNMYYHRPANELIFLTKSEHCKLHYTVCADAEEHKRKMRMKRSEETKLKLSNSHKGLNTWLKGQTRSEFSMKFNEHYGITHYEDHKLYYKEYVWYRNHNNKCRWEIE